MRRKGPRRHLKACERQGRRRVGRDGRRRATCDVVQPFAGRAAVRCLRFVAFCSHRYLSQVFQCLSQVFVMHRHAFAYFLRLSQTLRPLRCLRPAATRTCGRIVGVGRLPRRSAKLRHRGSRRANATPFLDMGAGGRGTERSGRRSVGDWHWQSGRAWAPKAQKWAGRLVALACLLLRQTASADSPYRTRLPALACHSAMQCTYQRHSLN